MTKTLLAVLAHPDDESFGLGGTLAFYASKGYDLVIAHGSQFGASLADIAPDFPKTAFAWGTAVDTFASKGVKNISAYTVASDQGGYVEGVIAAKLSKSGSVGAIGPVAGARGRGSIVRTRPSIP